MSSHIPNKEDLLILSDPELAQNILKWMLEESRIERPEFAGAGSVVEGNKFHRRNTVIRIAQESAGSVGNGYHAEQPPEVRDKAMAAMSWLEKNGYVAPAFGDGNDYQITNLGFSAAENLPDLPLPDASLLPLEQLHPRLQDRAWHDFVRGDYSGAIFKAFQEVEISVRSRSALDPSLTGVKLMRQAFDASNGPLTDQEAEPSEKEAMAHLFAGAFGSLRNPNGHRTMEYSGPEIPRGAIMLADMLLRFVDETYSDGL